MSGRGFIHDDLEIKFLILYIAARTIDPVPFETLQDLAMCDEAVDYFSFSQCLSELVETGHLAADSETGLYAITPKGRRSSEICESSLPYSVRLRCEGNLAVCNRALRRAKQVKASVEPRPDGVYTAALSLEDDAGSILDLKLMVPRQEMGRLLARRFQKAPEALYRQLLDLLLREAEAESPES